MLFQRACVFIASYCSTRGQGADWLGPPPGSFCQRIVHDTVVGSERLGLAMAAKRRLVDSTPRHCRGGDVGRGRTSE